MLTLSSRSALPVRWAIRPEDLLLVAGGEGKEAGEEDFTLTPTFGLLPPGGSVSVAVTFHAREPAQVSRSFRVDVTDSADPPVVEVVETYDVALTAEAYNIDVKVEWPDAEAYNGLDFGSFKVVNEKPTSLEVRLMAHRHTRHMTHYHSRREYSHM